MISAETSMTRPAEPQLPPLLSSHPVDPPGDPFVAAVRGAGEGRLGAGDLLWARAAARAELALVLEPDVACERSIEMGPLLWVAVVDGLAASMPPKTSLLLRWPDIVLVNGGAAGQLRFASAPAVAGEVPAWLVIGVSLQLASISELREPGEAVDRTSLVEEGGGELTSGRLIESIAAHILTWINIWQDEGFRPVHDAWVGRVEGHDGNALVRHRNEEVRGRVRGLDATLALIVEPAQGPERAFALADLFDACQERAPS